MHSCHGCIGKICMNIISQQEVDQDALPSATHTYSPHLSYAISLQPFYLVCTVVPAI